MPPEAGKKKMTLEVSEKNLFDVDAAELNPADIGVLKKIIEFKPVKVQLQVIVPPAKTELNEKGREKRARAGADETIERYQKLLSKQSRDALQVIVDAYREDQGGKKGAYSTADSALSKLNKHIEKVMEDFRIDLRESIAKHVGEVGAKELMTVGSISTKDSTIIRGSFKSESAMDSKDESMEEDLSSALKSKKWQYVGLAASSDTAKIVVNKKKEFKKADLGKSMDKLFPENERAGLKYSIGMIKAEGQTNLEFEFLDKSKPGKDPRTFETRLKKGLKEQIKFNGHLEIKAVKEYTVDAKKPSPSTSTPTPGTSTTTTTST